MNSLKNLGNGRVNDESTILTVNTIGISGLVNTIRPVVATLYVIKTSNDTRLCRVS